MNEWKTGRLTDEARKMRPNSRHTLERRSKRAGIIKWSLRLSPKDDDDLQLLAVDDKRLEIMAEIFEMEDRPNRENLMSLLASHNRS